MIIAKMYQYNGPGKPIASVNVDAVFMAPWMKVLAMSEEEHDYLSALELMHGTKLDLHHFEAFHDGVWDRAVAYGIANTMDNLMCSHSAITELLMKLHGVEIWKRELKRRERIEQHIRCSPQGIFL